MTAIKLLGHVAVLLFLVLSATPLDAQGRKRIPDHSFERATVIDADGLKQWAAWDVPCPVCKRTKVTECQLCKGRDWSTCVECDGTRIATCRACVGTARLPDPIVAASCAICLGAGVFPCSQCKGAGTYPVISSDGSPRTERCRTCKERGGFECRPCGGTGLLQTVAVKKKPIAEAKLKDVILVRDVLRVALADLEGFEHEASHRKTEKALEKLLKDPSKRYPALKETVALLKEVHKAFSKVGPEFDNYDGEQTHQFYIFQDRTVWLLRRQLLVLDLEIARAEFNAPVLAQQK